VTGSTRSKPRDRRVRTLGDLLAAAHPQVAPDDDDLLDRSFSGASAACVRYRRRKPAEGGQPGQRAAEAGACATASARSRSAEPLKVIVIIGTSSPNYLRS
jgi:hypothetical protein